MKSQLTLNRPRTILGVGNILNCGFSRVIRVAVLTLSSVIAQAESPWFSGYLDPHNSYRIYAYTDWDSPLFGAGISPDTTLLGVTPPNRRVDGHVIFQADGTGNCTIIEATGSCAQWIGLKYPISVQFSGWWCNPSTPPASDTRHDWDANFLNIVSDLVPTFTTRFSSTNFSLAWSTNASGYKVQCSTDLRSNTWLDVTNNPVIVGGNFSVTLSTTQSAGFFRLKR